jgi:hypothetical protein
LREKKTNTQLLEEIKRNITAEESNVALEKLQAKISLQDITLEEKIQEASKPLYLKRYE